MALNKLLAIAAVLEAATGLVLIIHPSLVSWLLLGEVVSGAGIVVGRVAGFALLSLGLACWPGIDSAGVRNSALRALLAYNLLTTLYSLSWDLPANRSGAYCGRRWHSTRG